MQVSLAMVEIQELLCVVALPPLAAIDPCRPALSVLLPFLYCGADPLAPVYSLFLADVLRE